ncbi:SURF1 family protein [Nitrincola sp.]|uniref:SURF1 family protein n=1 Tax=Nitrincola sp. TaxID=1926584 RepID=UPI003A93C6BF
MNHSEALKRRGYKAPSRSKNTRQVKRLISLTLWWGLWMSLMLVGLALANWQWQRAAEKTELLTQWAATEMLYNPVVEPENLAQVTLTGHFLAEETLWLDNRILQGQVGVAVLTPFVSDSGHWWLIQRGFIATVVDRRVEPEVTTPNSSLEVSGYWQQLQQGNLVFGDNREGNRLQSLDLSPWSHLPQPHFQGVVHQSAGDGQLASWWKPSQMPPERHIAYAVQWLCLAVLALVVAVIGHRVLYRKTCQQDNL